MTNHLEEVRNALLLLLESYQAIASLDLDVEEQGEQLFGLQNKQDELRLKLDDLGLKRVSHDPEIRILLQELYRIGEQVQTKLEAFKRDISNQFTKFQDGHRVRHAYGQAYGSEQGFFIDNRK